MLKKIDGFTRNIIIVFAGTSLASFFNLVFQLLIAHRLAPSDFAAFNSLLAIFMVVSAPLGTLQLAIAKYAAAFHAQNQPSKITFLLSDLIKKIAVLAVASFALLWFFAFRMSGALKINSVASGYLLAGLVATAWLAPIFLGGVQGLEKFNWLSSVSVLTGALKLALGFLLIQLGYNIGGALGALLVSQVLLIALLHIPMRQYVNLSAKREEVNYKEICLYLFPLALSSFCFITLVSSDMILVKYFFSPSESGNYSLAQMVGKIFLFLPGAVSMVMFPRTSGLNAKNQETEPILKRSLLYVFLLCSLAYIFYSFFPEFVLKVLTGKALPESLKLGRLFGVSMSLYALINVLMYYFLSIKDLRFIKFLVVFTLLQTGAIFIYHAHLVHVQLVLCVNAIALFLVLLTLAFGKRAGLVKK